MSFLFTLPACSFSSEYHGTNEAIRETVKIVIKLENSKGQHREALCSGVIIGPNEILTAGHCVETPYKVINIWVRDIDGRSQPALVEKVAPGIDLALLEIVIPEKHWARISNHLEVGDAVEAVGMPMGLEWTSTFGHVSALHRMFANRGENGDLGEYTQFDAPINGGNSGGGLWDRHGRLVGIVTAHVTPCWFGSWSGLSFAVNMSTIKEFLKS